MRLDLCTKLIGSFVIILLLMVVVGLVGACTSNHIQNHLEDIVEQDVKAANTLGVVARRVGFIHSNSLLHLITRSIDDTNRYESEIADWEDKVSTDLDTLENTFRDQATLDKLAEFRTAWETYLRVWNNQVVPLSRANRDEEAFALARKGGAAGMAAREAMYKLDELHDAITAIADDSLELAEQDFRKSQNILLAVILLTIILGLTFGIKQSSLIAGAVNTVSKAAQLVAAGDLDQSVTVRTGDEIEAMADSFNIMTSNMKEMVKELRHEITGRRRAEEALRESEQWLSTTLKSIGDAVIATDAQGLVTLVNPVAEDLIGWDEAQAVGQPLENVFHITNEQTGERVENPVDRVLREGVVVGLANDTVLIAKDGTKRPIADSGAPMRDEEGNIIGAVIVFRDVTERKQAEEELRKHRDHLEELVEERTQALRESEKMLRDLIESVPIGISISTPGAQGTVTDVNSTLLQTFGYASKEEFLEAPVSAHYYDPEERGRFSELCKRGPVKNYETRFKRKDGTVFWGSATSIARTTKAGTTCFINTFEDITERKRAEEELIRMSNAVRMSIDSIVISDLEGKIIDVNDVTLKSYGTDDKGDLIGKSSLDLIAPKDREEAFAGMEEVLEKGYSESREYHIVTKDGSRIPVEMSVSIMKDVDGEPTGFVGITRDITERRRAEEALKEYSERLEEMVEERTQELWDAQEQLVRKEKLAVMGQLAGGVGHELRNPLGVMSNAVYFLRMTLADADETTSEYLGIISSEVRTAEKIVSDLLGFSRTRMPEREEIAVSELVAQALAKRPPPEDIKVATQIPSGLPPVYADPHQMGQVLGNLVANAYQAMPEGGQLIIETSEVSGKPPRSGGVVLSIADTGCGIPQKNLAKIFEPLFTTRARGIGLGLAVSKSLVETNGGSIEVESEVGKGSTFTVTLPTKEVKA